MLVIQKIQNNIKDKSRINSFKQKLINYENKLDNRLMIDLINQSTNKKITKQFCIIFNKKIIGFLEIKKDKEIYKNNQKVYVLTQLYIDNKFRHKGFGKKALHMLLKLLKIQNINYIIIPVLAKNKSAKRFWKSLNGEKYIEELLIKI